jgi:hypothetical protein
VTDRKIGAAGVVVQVRHFEPGTGARQGHMGYLSDYRLGNPCFTDTQRRSLSRVARLLGRVPVLVHTEEVTSADHTPAFSHTET